MHFSLGRNLLKWTLISDHKKGLKGEQNSYKQLKRNYKCNGNFNYRRPADFKTLNRFYRNRNRKKTLSYFIWKISIVSDPFNQLLVMYLTETWYIQDVMNVLSKGMQRSSHSLIFQDFKMISFSLGDFLFLRLLGNICWRGLKWIGTHSISYLNKYFGETK